MPESGRYFQDVSHFFDMSLDGDTPRTVVKVMRKTNVDQSAALVRRAKLGTRGRCATSSGLCLATIRPVRNEHWINGELRVVTPTLNSTDPNRRREAGDACLAAFAGKRSVIQLQRPAVQRHHAREVLIH